MGIKIIKKGPSIFKVKYTENSKTYIIDLYKELNINSKQLEEQLKSNPYYYAMICKLKNQAIRERDKLEKERDEIFSKIYITAYENGTKVTKELANHKANISAKYQMACDKYLEAKEVADNLISISIAFEMKSRLIQTVSSNHRR